jgi:hypothetical protein
MKTHQVTIEELQAGISLETGEHHKIIVTRSQVLLEVEWDESVVEELPEDLVWSLTVKGVVQRQEIRSGVRENGRVRVAFRWTNESDATSLLVSTDGRDVPLWKNKVIARDPHLNALAVLIKPAEEPAVGDNPGTEVIATVEPGPHGDPTASDSGIVT